MPADVHFGWQCIRCKMSGGRPGEGGGPRWMLIAAEQQGMFALTFAMNALLTCYTSLPHHTQFAPNLAIPQIA